jgi:hypothetical protein
MTERKEKGPQGTKGLEKVILFPRPPKPTIHGAPELDEKARELRGQIADGIQKTLLRLGLSSDDRLSQDDAASIINKNLLGLIDDNTPLLFIIPKGTQGIGKGRIKNDPLYRHIIDKLKPDEISNAASVLTVLGRLIRWRSQGIGMSLGPRLETVSDARKISPAEWAGISGFSESRGKFMYEIFKKIEIPNE